MKRSKLRGASRREFLDTSVKFGVGVLAASRITENLGTNLALAQQAVPGRGSRNLPAEIARFVVGTRYEALSPKALEWAKTAMLDCLGTALAGSREESGRICFELAQEEKAKGETSLYGHRFKSSVAQGAFVNGTAAHATDFDHSFVIGGQPTAPIIPAVFALGESLGASGKQILDAYAAGFEVATRLVFAQQKAGAAPGPYGGYGATTACARLLGLKETEIETALGITYTMAGGATFAAGTMSKPLSVGLAARCGVLAPTMARMGFTAGQPQMAPFEELGKVSFLEKYGIRLKPYPCGGLTHSAIFATIQLRNQNKIAPNTVEHIDVAVPQGTANAIAYKIPETGLQGKFCMGYLVARALIDGKLTLEAFTDQAVKDKDVLRLVEKVEMRVDPALPPSTSSDGSRPATITIKLTNGQSHMLYQQFPKGSPQVPMTLDELKEKFRSCGRGVISLASCEKAIQYITTIETMAAIKPLTDLLRGA